MDKKSKILVIAFVLLIIGAVGATYWRVFVKKDYLISNQVDCDPYTEKCFIWRCDPNSTKEGETCTGEPDKDIWYYKVIERKAYNIPLCNPDEDENCQPFVCGENEKGCKETLCEENNPDKIECNNPEEYTKNNPIEEESACDSSVDETCASSDSGE